MSTSSSATSGMPKPTLFTLLIGYVRKAGPFLALDWRKGAFLIGYFLLMGVFAALRLEVAFSILAWPTLLFKGDSAGAAISQMLFAYIVAATLDALIFRDVSASDTKQTHGKQKRKG